VRDVARQAFAHAQPPQLMESTLAITLPIQHDCAKEAFGETSRSPARRQSFRTTTPGRSST